VRNEEKCLKSLKRMRKELNADASEERTDTAFLLGQLGIIRSFLIPLAESCTTNEDEKILTEATKVVVQLTMPIGVADKNETKFKRLQQLQRFKSEFLRPGALHAFLRLLERPLSESGKSQRNQEDKLIVELVLWLLRNLLAVPDHVAKNMSSMSRNSHLAHLHSDFLVMLSEESVFEIVLFLAEYVSSEGNKEWNFVLLEIFYQIFRGAEAEDLFVVEDEGQAVLQRNFAQDMLRRSASPSNAVANLGLQNRLKRVQASNSSLESLSSRHSRFGGALRLKIAAKSNALATNAFDLHEKTSRSVAVEITQANRERKKTRRKKKDGEDEEFAQSHQELHVMGNDVRLPIASAKLREVQHGLCKNFISRCYASLCKSLKNSFRREDSRVLETDHYQFVWLAGFCMSFQREMVENEGNAAETSWEAAPVLATMDLWTFFFVINSCDVHETNKKEQEMRNCMRMLGSMVQLLETMLKTKIPEEKLFAVKLRNKVFHTAFEWEIVTRHIRLWDANKNSWSDLAHLASFSASLLNIMTQMQDERVVIKSRRRQKKRRTKERKRAAKESGLNQGKEWSTEETMALAEAVKQYGSTGKDFRKALKDETLAPIFDESRTFLMLMHRWRRITFTMEHQRLKSVDAFLQYERDQPPGADDDFDGEDEEDEKGELEAHKAETERELKINSILKQFATNTVLENLIVLLDPGRAPLYVKEPRLKYLQDDVVPKFLEKVATVDNEPALWHASLFAIYGKALKTYSESERPRMTSVLTTIIESFFKHAEENPLAFVELLVWRTKHENERLLWHYEEFDMRKSKLLLEDDDEEPRRNGRKQQPEDDDDISSVEEEFEFDETKVVNKAGDEEEAKGKDDDGNASDRSSSSSISSSSSLGSIHNSNSSKAKVLKAKRAAKLAAELAANGDNGKKRKKKDQKKKKRLSKKRKKGEVHVPKRQQNGTNEKAKPKGLTSAPTSPALKKQKPSHDASQMNADAQEDDDNVSESN